MEEYEHLLKQIKKEAEGYVLKHDHLDLLKSSRSKTEELLVKKLSLENIISFKTLDENKHKRIYDVISSIIGEVDNTFLEFTEDQAEKIQRGASKLLVSTLYKDKPTFLAPKFNERLDNEAGVRRIDLEKQYSYDEIMAKLKVLEAKTMVNETLMKTILKCDGIMQAQSNKITQLNSQIAKVNKRVGVLERSCYRLLQVFKKTPANELAAKLEEVADNAKCEGKRALEFCVFKKQSDAHAEPVIKRKAVNQEDKNKKPKQ